MKPYTPLFALGILFLVLTNSLLADPETGTAIKNQNQKLIVELPASSSSIDRTDAIPIYKRADLPVDERVGDLLGRMTLEEKVRQLDMYYGCQDLVDKKQTIDNHAVVDKLRGEGALRDWWFVCTSPGKQFRFTVISRFRKVFRCILNFRAACVRLPPTSSNRRR